MHWLDDDTTPPVITGTPSSFSVEATGSNGATATYTDPTATDDVDGSVPVNCTPGSGSTFSLGDNLVTCLAHDAAGNPASESFTITVVDTTPPIVTPPADVSVTTGDPSGQAVAYGAGSASDAVAGSPTVGCLPASGSKFSVGTTTVTCTASDGTNIGSASFSVTVTLVDTTAPSVSVPGTITKEAAGPSGASVPFTVSASDLVDPSPSISCDHSSGATFPIGSTLVSCTAKDASNNVSQPATFTVNVVDTTGPVLTLPGPLITEANGPTGSIVNFVPAPSALDSVNGAEPVLCIPASGFRFPIKVTTVTCSASDSKPNTSSATFSVTVRDTKPPNLIVPAARSVYATTPTGVPNTVSGVVSFLSAASATDIVDPSPVITNSAPSFLPVGNLTITFGARDFSGNVTYKNVNLIVLPQPPPGTPPLVIPPKPTIPAQPTNVRITPLDGAVRIQWNAGGRQVMVTRSSSSNRSLSAIGDERVVYTGNGSSYTDRGLENGIEYRYVVMALDAAGNHSVGVAGVVVPRRNLLKSPRDGARLRKAPKLIWARDAEAQYYNAQLLLNGKKILSVWPVRPTYALKKNWKYLGRKYTLKPGLYSWYVFPGYGARSAVHYGDVMGSRTFRIVR